MATYLIQKSTLNAIADKIREKTGQTGALRVPDGMIQAIGTLDNKSVSADIIRGFADRSLSGEIELPQGTSLIAEGVFKGTQITSVTVPSSVASIDHRAFKDCMQLESVTIAEGVKTVGDAVFQTCRNLKSIVFPDSITSFGTTVLDNCVAMESVKLPGRMTEIPYAFFYSNLVLPQIELPESIASIAKWGFCGCRMLKNLTIPQNVTSIGEEAFKNCIRMESYLLRPVSPPALGINAFDGNPENFKIFVPSGSLNAYRTAQNWSAWADHMVGY